MTRTLSAGLAAHLAGNAHTRCRMLRLDMANGDVLAVTDHDREISFDLGDGEATYSPRTGILPSDLSLSVGFDADDIEVAGPLVESASEAWHVTQAMVLGGKFDDAVVRLFEVNWHDLSQGAAKMLGGYVVLGEVDGSRFKLTVHSELSKFKQEVGDVLSPYCKRDFGTGLCDRVPVTLAATVTGVTSERLFTVSFAGSFADDFFNKGTVQFLTGALAGGRPVEISDWLSSGSVVLWTALAQAPQVGDTLTVRQGCFDPASGQSKTRAACMALGGDALPMGGFPDVPGTDQVLRYPNPGG